MCRFFGQKWEKKQEKCCCVCHPEWDFVEFQSCQPSPERSPSKKAKSQMDKDGLREALENWREKKWKEEGLGFSQEIVLSSESIEKILKEPTNLNGIVLNVFKEEVKREIRKFL
jgi:hypothetical protein